MKKSDFTNIYSDVYEQTIECKYTLSRADNEKIVIGLCSSMKTGLLGFEVRDNTIHVFTSDEILVRYNQMVKGVKVVDVNGFDGEITSEHPFLCGGDMCVRVSYSGAAADAYSCDFFKPLEL